MSYTSVVQQFPAELQFPVLRLVEAVTEDLRGQLAVRREDFAALQMAVVDLGVAQKRGEERLSRLEVVMVELAEAQQGTANPPGSGGG